MDDNKVNDYEFHYAFQITKYIIFNVDYYTCGNNDSPYFATSADEFNHPKTDFNRCGQCQSDLCTGLALQFFEKWNYLHLHTFHNKAQFMELLEDIEELKSKYNYIESIADKNPDTISFSRERELSKLELKK